MRSESSNYKLKIFCFEICVETNQPTDPDTDFKMVHGRTIKILDNVIIQEIQFLIKSLGYQEHRLLQGWELWCAFLFSQMQLSLLSLPAVTIW